MLRHRRAELEAKAAKYLAQSQDLEARRARDVRGVWKPMAGWPWRFLGCGGGFLGGRLGGLLVCWEGAKPKFETCEVWKVIFGGYPYLGLSKWCI